MNALTFTTHDDLPLAEAKIVDRGLEAFNHQVAPLDGMVPMACFARDGDGQVVGGAVGRRWGACCELQQLWVAESQRRQGIGAALLSAFETHALERGCASIFLETFSFQSPPFYAAHGYQVDCERHGFPNGIVKYHLAKPLKGSQQ